jgi:potassium-transporting ATPase potassium-binding subunit
MDARPILETALLLGLVGCCTLPLGGYMAAVLSGRIPRAARALAPVERWMYRLAGCTPTQEMHWTAYARALLLFNLCGILAVLALQRLQPWLPMNPQHLPAVPVGLAMNTAVSFATNTNWQAYAGEVTMSHLTQMLGLAVQNFLSAATGMAVLAALARGLARSSCPTLGNFWADLVRSTVYVLLPLSLVLAVLLVSQGVVQSVAPNVTVTTLEGTPQTIPLGPAASQVAIKQLGTNGGGFFGANSAHPLENPTPLTNALELLAILLLPAALTCTYGRMLGAPRQGWVLFAAMAVLFLAALAGALAAELACGSMEGKETRCGIWNSVVWATATTAASNGSVNAMHDSLSPLAGLVALVNMLLGEVVFGGVGSGLYGMVMFVLLTVFMAGLMVGRSPEYLGKRVEGREVAMAMVAVLGPSVLVLLLSAIAAATPAGLDSISQTGPHGLSQILYAFASTANNNGSAFAGLNANTWFYNGLGALAMLLGRFGVILPVLAVAGSMAAKKTVPPSLGTFRTDDALFAFLLVAVIVLVGALTFLPALTLGPLLEHLLWRQGWVFRGLAP